MFQVQRYRKIKSAVGLRNVTAHNMRHNIYDKDGEEIENPQKDSKYYDPSMASHNQYSDDIEKPEQVLKKRAERIEAADLKRKPQKNASMAVEGVFSASPEFSESWRNSKKDMQAWSDYLKKSEKWAKDKFGKENVLHVAVHYDEKTPHMHVLFTPIIKKDGRNVYSSSNFLGGRDGMRKLQTEYHKDIGKKLNLDRGIEGSRMEHTWVKGLHQKEKQVKIQQKNIDKNKHLLTVNLPDKVVPEPIKNPVKRNLYLHNSSDGLKKDMKYKEWLEYETKMRPINKIHKLAVEKNIAVKELESTKSDLEQTQKDLNKSNNIVQSYRNATAQQLRDLADKREQKAKKIEQSKSKSKGRARSIFDDKNKGKGR